MANITSLLAGLIFGLGLIVSGLANPAKVIGFLDLAGQWDPSLALVMAGAIGIGVIAFTVAQKRAETMLGTELKLAGTTHIDRRLVVGSAIFGVGWGIAGFCPGPGLVALGMGIPQAALFVLAMVAGMAWFELLERRAARHHQPVAA